MGASVKEIVAGFKNRGALAASCVFFYCCMTGLICLIVGLTGLEAEELRGTCYLHDSINADSECAGDVTANCWTCETIRKSDSGEIELESPKFYGVQFRSQGEEFACSSFIADPGKGTTSDTRMGAKTCKTQRDLLLESRQQSCTLEELDNRCLTDLARSNIYGTDATLAWIRLILGVVFCACSATIPGFYIMSQYRPSQDEVTQFEKKTLPLEERAKIDR